MVRKEQQTRLGYQLHSSIDNLSLHTDLINEWDFLYHQVSSGKFSGNLNHFRLDGIGIYEEHLSTCIFQQGQAKDDTICISVFRHLQQPALWMREAIDEDDVICIYPQSEVLIKAPAASVFYALHFPASILSDMTDSSFNNALNSIKNKYFNLQLHQKMLEMITYIQHGTVLKWTDLARHYLKSDLIDLGYRYINAVQVGIYQEPISKVKAKEVVKYLIHYWSEHKDQPISIEKCCQLTQMSRRTLQNYFEAVTGQSPSLYLKYLGLNGVHRMLQHPENNITVGNAASHWGFWHLSQFATDKRLFREVPSETRRLNKK